MKLICSITLTIFIIASGLCADDDFTGLAALKGQTDQLEKEFIKVEQTFETAKLEHNTTMLNETLAEIKVTKVQLYQIEAKIHKEISNLHTNNFIGRIEVETYRIKVNKLNQALNWIAHEILGHQVNISDFVQRQFSEALELTVNLEDGKYEHLIGVAKQAHKLIEAALDKKAKGDKVETTQSAEIHKQLQLMIIDATSFKESVANKYQEVTEKLEMQNKDLNLVQKYQITRLVVELSYMAQFVQTYMTLIKELI